MDVRDFYQLLEKNLLGKLTLQEFADELSRLWSSDKLFYDPYRMSNDGYMNRVLSSIIEIVFESGEVYDPTLLDEEVVGLIGDDEFRREILNAYTKLIIFLYQHPEYMFLTNKY